MLVNSCPDVDNSVENNPHLTQQIYYSKMLIKKSAKIKTPSDIFEFSTLLTSPITTTITTYINPYTLSLTCVSSADRR